MIATPYLDAIQKIPGDTASQKMKWLGQLSKNQPVNQKGSGDIKQVSCELQPILRVEAAVRKKIHQDVTSALKSEDVTIVRRALQATWFFDGSHKDIVNVKYLRERIFEFVSVNTRLYIIKTFALRLKDPHFAQQIFSEVESVYGIHYALPLIVVCDEEFAYRTIVAKRINLPFAIAKKIFRRNIDLIVRYLRLSDTWVRIKDYTAFFPTLVKKRLSTFAELYEMHEKNPPKVVLSNTCADIFLKNGLYYLMKKPLLYIKILPLKKIHETNMEKLFPGLMPENPEHFQMDEMLKYLEHYPEAKRFDLLSKSYMDKYGLEVFAKLSNVTPNVLLLVSPEERIKQSRIKLTKELGNKSIDKNNDMSFSIWICYLPITESIPCIKNTISKMTSSDNRVILLGQMITACKVNEDENALLDFITYFSNRHKNEEDWVYDRVMKKLVSLYNLPHLSTKTWSALNEVIVLFYVKYGWVSKTVLLALIHYRLLQNLSITEQITMLIETQINKTHVNFEHMFQKHPRYKRQCLVTCTEVLQKNCENQNWLEKEDFLVFHLVVTMYRFNENLDKEKNKSYADIKRMSIKDYPWLQRTLYHSIVQNDYHSRSVIKKWFKKYEPELCNRWFKQTEEPKFYIDEVRTGNAFRLLKSNMQMIMEHWVDYMEACKKYSSLKSVHRFIRATRWYKDLPILLVKHCQEKWLLRKDSNYLVIMALLLDGHTMANIIEPLIPEETKIKVNINKRCARHSYACVEILPLVMRVSNPPVPLDVVAKLCEGDYLTVGLVTLTSACRRSPLPNVMSFAENLAEKRVGITKHGIRMMYLVAPLQQLQQFFLSWWQKKKHHSIRAVLLKNTQDMFFKDPNETTWSLFKCLVSTMSIEDNLLSDLNMRNIPTEYIVDYIELLFDVVHKLLEQECPLSKVIDCIHTLLNLITEQICDNLKEDFIKMLLLRYLFHQNEQLSSMAVKFVVCSYLLTSKGMCPKRMDTFSEIFRKRVTDGWDKSHPEKRNFYPVNYSVRDLIEKFVNKTLLNKGRQPDVIAKMLQTFLSVLTPQAEPRCYLLLVYAYERMKSTSAKQFGLQVGTKMPELMKKFSLMFVPLASNILKDLPRHNVFNEQFEEIEVTLDIAQGLIDANNMVSYFIAADFLTIDIPCDNQRHRTLVEKLMDMKCPDIMSLLNNCKNQVPSSSMSESE